MSAGVERVAAKQPRERQVNPTREAVRFEGLDRVFRARGRESARRREQRRYHSSIEPECEDDRKHRRLLGFHCHFSGNCAGVKRPACLQRSVTASITSAPLASAVARRAINTIRHPSGGSWSPRARRSPSRRSRFARFRRTAPPTLRLATTAHLNPNSSLFRQSSTTNGERNPIPRS